MINHGKSSKSSTSYTIIIYIWSTTCKVMSVQSVTCRNYQIHQRIVSIVKDLKLSPSVAYPLLSLLTLSSSSSALSVKTSSPTAFVFSIFSLYGVLVNSGQFSLRCTLTVKEHRSRPEREGVPPSEARTLIWKQRELNYWNIVWNITDTNIVKCNLLW